MTRRRELTVGAVILLSVAVLVAGTLWLKGDRIGTEATAVSARFREVGQLTEGNPVKLRGVPIGRVEEVRLEPMARGVIVRMMVDDKIALPQDPVVVVAPQSLFGDWQAEIGPRARYADYDFVESPDPQVLPGYSLPDASQITAVADRIAENLAVLTDRVELAFTEETALNIQKAIENIQSVSGELTRLAGSQREAIDQLRVELERTTRSMGRAAELAHRTFARIDSSMADGEMEEIVDNVHRASRRVDSLSTALLAASEQFRTVAASTERAAEGVETVTTQIREGRGTLGRLVQDTAFYSELVRTNRMMQELLEDIQENPTRYLHLRIF